MTEKKENIFDLTKPVKPEYIQKNKPKLNVVSAEEQTQLLEGFIEVPRDKWINLNDGDILRYLRKDGAFRKGGIFKNSWIGTSGKYKDKKCIQLVPLFSAKYGSNTWTVCIDEIEKIWKKKGNEMESTTNNSSNNSSNYDNKLEILTEKVDFLNKTIDQQKIDLLKLRNEQTRIINLIKKLHNIKSSK